MRQIWGWEALATFLGYGKRVVIRVPLPHSYNLSNFSIHKCIETNKLIITADAEAYSSQTISLGKPIFQQK
jgi:hypothetical protein